MKSKNIIIIGYRGAGKTTVSRALSQRLNWNYIGIDDLIKTKIGSIFESVEKHGWQEFQSAEREVIAGLYVNESVIDTGGGVVLTWGNIEYLKALGPLCFLNANCSTLVERLKQSHARPSIKNNKSTFAEVEEVLHERLALYRKAADMEIDVDDKDVNDIVSIIIGKVKQ